MTPTVTIPLADYLMLKEDIKNLEKSLIEKSVVIKTITRSCGGEYIEEEYRFMDGIEAVNALKKHYDEKEAEYERLIKQLNGEANDLRRKYEPHVEEYLRKKFKPKAWWKIF